MANVKIVKGNVKFNPVTIQFDIDSFELYSGLIDMFNSEIMIDDLSEDQREYIYEFLTNIGECLTQGNKNDKSNS